MMNCAVFTKNEYHAEQMELYLRHLYVHTYSAHSISDLHTLLQQHIIHCIFINQADISKTTEAVIFHMQQHLYDAALCIYSLQAKSINFEENWKQDNEAFLSRIQIENNTQYQHYELLFNKAASHIKKSTGEKILSFSDFIINYGDKQIIKNGEKYYITQKTWRLLEILTQPPGIAYSLDNLSESLWGKIKQNRKNSIYVYIHALRKILEIEPAHPEILIRDKKGHYKIVIPH